MEAYYSCRLDWTGLPNSHFTTKDCEQCALRASLISVLSKIENPNYTVAPKSNYEIET